MVKYFRNKSRKSYNKLINSRKLKIMIEKINVQNGHRLLLVNINRSNDPEKAFGKYDRPNLYERARKYWLVKKERADLADYVLGVFKGVVRVVIKPTSKWMPSDVSSDGTRYSKTRYMVEGITDDEEGNRLYLHKDVADFPFGSGGVIRYIPKELKYWK